VGTCPDIVDHTALLADAARLRNAAGQLRASLATQVHRVAAETAWSGAKPAMCRLELLETARRLVDAADDLDDLASALRARAGIVDVFGRSSIG
jgi:hypothetical protein